MTPAPRRRKELTQFEPSYLAFFICAIPFGVGLAFAVMIATTLGFGIPLHPALLGVLLVLGFYICQQSQLSKERLWRRTKLPVFARWRFGAERAAQTCGYCRDALGDEEPEACPECGAADHPSCRAELGGCGTLGCDAAARPAPAKTTALKA